MYQFTSIHIVAYRMGKLKNTLDCTKNLPLISYIVIASRIKTRDIPFLLVLRSNHKILEFYFCNIESKVDRIQKMINDLNFVIFFKLVFNFQLPVLISI